MAIGGSGNSDGSVTIKIDGDASGLRGTGQVVSTQMQRMNISIRKTLQEIDKLTTQMRALESTTIHTEEYDKYASKINSAKMKLEELIAINNQLESELGPGAESNAQWRRINNQIADTSMKIEIYQQKLDELATKDVNGTQTEQYARLNQQLDNAYAKLQMQNQQYDEMAMKESNVVSEQESMNRAMNRSTSTANSFVGTLKSIQSAGNRAFSIIKNRINSINSPMKKMEGVVTKSLRKIKNMFLKAFIFSQILKAIQSIRDKMKLAIAQNTQLSNSIGQIKGNLNTAFAGLYRAALPAIITITNAVAKLTAGIASFISLISGKSVKSNQKFAQSLDAAKASADATNKSVNETKKTLAGFDDMEVLSSQSSSHDTSSSGDTTIKPIYDEIDSSTVNSMIDKFKDAWKNADFTDIGISVGNKITDVLNSIDWDKIQNVADKLGKSVATGLNGIIYGTDWNVVGNSFAQGLNTAIELAYSFVTNFDFSKFGKSIGETVNSFFKNVDWAKMGKTVGKSISGVFTTAFEFLNTIDWDVVGEKVITFITNIDWGTLVTQLGLLILTVIKSAFLLLFGAVAQISESVASFFEDIGLDGIAGFFKGISDSLKTSIKWIKDKFEKYIVEPVKEYLGIHSPSTLFAEIGNYVIEGLKNGISNAIGAIKQIFIKSFNDVKATTIGIFNNIKTTISNIMDTTKRIISGIIDKIKDKFNSISSTFKDVVSHIKSGVENIAKAIKSIPDTVANIIDSIKNKAKDIGTAMSDAVMGTFKTVVNSVFRFIENRVNGFIDAINSVVGTINKIPGVSIDRIQKVSLPRLASGTVVPANYGEFAAILGDNKRETEVVSPLSTMKEALLQAMRENGGTGTQNINLVVELDGDTVYNKVVQINNRNIKLTGNNNLAY